MQVLFGTCHPTRPGQEGDQQVPEVEEEEEEEEEDESTDEEEPEDEEYDDDLDWQLENPGAEASGEEEVSDTEILGDSEEVEQELGRLGQEDVTSCTCCTACTRRKANTGRPTSSYSSLKAGGSRRRERTAERVRSIVCPVEAADVVARLGRDFPSTAAPPPSNLSLVTAIRTLGLTFNKVVSIILILLILLMILLMILMILIHPHSSSSSSSSSS